MEKIKLVIVDDHKQLRHGLSRLLCTLGYEVLFDCGNGVEFQELLEKDNLPDIVLIDIQIPMIDGLDMLIWLKGNYPLVSVLTLSIYEEESAIIKMLKYGTKGFINKDSEAYKLKSAIGDIIYGNLYSPAMKRSPAHPVTTNQSAEVNLNPPNQNELEFLRLSSTPISYKEIADSMHLSTRMIDGLGDTLLKTFTLKAGSTLCCFAVKNNVA